MISKSLNFNMRFQIGVPHPIIFFSFCILFTFLVRSQDTRDDRTLMAIFAHPDDEMTVSPMLVNYVDQGVKVYLVICTDGRLGTNDFTDHEAGDGLAEMRRAEMSCAAEKLGVELIHLNYHDQLRAAEGYDGHVPHAKQLIMELDSLIADKKPDALITWGPDGGSTHMDHRLVGASVTQVFVSALWEKTKKLYYVGTPANLIEEVERKKLAGVEPSLLNVAVPYSKSDLERAIESLKCHKSQVSPEMLEWRKDAAEKSNYTIYFREFTAPETRKKSIFE